MDWRTGCSRRVPALRELHQSRDQLVAVVGPHDPIARGGQTFRIRDPFHRKRHPRRRLSHPVDETSAQPRLTRRRRMSSAPGQYLALVTKEEGSDWNVAFPDLLGCVTVGRSLDEAVAFAEEALALHVHGLREDREAPPAPSGIEDVMADSESAGVDHPASPAASPRAAGTAIRGGIRAANCSMTKPSGRSDEAS